MTKYSFSRRSIVTFAACCLLVWQENGPAQTPISPSVPPASDSVFTSPDENSTSPFRATAPKQIYELPAAHEPVVINPGANSLGNQTIDPAQPDASGMPPATAGLQIGFEESGQGARVTTAFGDFTLTIGGGVIADFLYHNARPVAPGTPFFLSPDSPFGFDQDTFDAHARQSNLSLTVTGPKIAEAWDTGAVFLVNFFDTAIIVDQYGLLPILAYGHITSDRWRFAAGLQFDIFNPLNPAVLPFSALGASGNTGTAFRGQARAERYFYPGPGSKVTVVAGISEPIASVLNPDFRLSEDNGWPNIEGRIAWAFGPILGGAAGKQPFEVGISGLVGQIRNTQDNVRVVADVWGLGADCRWAITDRFGIQAEVFTGQTIGTYGGGILQDINPDTFAGIRSTGGWAEVYYYLYPQTLHTHVGFGIDDPRDGDLAPLQRVRNQTWFANLIWDVTQQCRIAGELTYRQTWYSVLPDNEGFGFHTQFQWKF